MMCSEEDLKSIGLPLGPRKKLMGFLKDYEASLEAASLQQVPPPAEHPPEEATKPADLPPVSCEIIL